MEDKSPQEKPKPPQPIQTVFFPAPIFINPPKPTPPPPQNPKRMFNKFQRKKIRPFTERSGDWICKNCRNLNFAFRNECNRCHLSKKLVAEDKEKEVEKNELSQCENSNNNLKEIRNDNVNDIKENVEEKDEKMKAIKEKSENEKEINSNNGNVKDNSNTNTNTNSFYYYPSYINKNNNNRYKYKKYYGHNNFNKNMNNNIINNHNNN